RSDVAIGGRLIGLALHILGDQPGARRHLEPLVRSRVATARPSHIILYQYDQRVLLDGYCARVLWLQGCGDQARRLTESLVDDSGGSQLLQSALERLPAPALHHHLSLRLAELAAGLGSAGQIAEGLAVVDMALARAEQTEEGWCIAELLRTKGELLLLGRVPAAVATAETCFHQALEVARRQDALSWDLRATMSLARLWRGQERVTQARKLLAPVYRRFTEGFGTADLIAAKALLASVR